MDERDRSQSPSRRTSRVEQVVVRWLRRSRESSSRERVLGDGPAGDVPLEPRSCAIRLMVQVPRSPLLNSHGFSVTTNTPLQVHEVTTGGPADGKLVTGDHLLQINNVAVDDLSTEQAADIIRECQDTITMTILRNTVGPKSSFITPEKRAKLKSNPVKVHFAEEVMVNGHSQGNSLLFLPNVLKVYLENGQTKAFKFDPKTTVKDIVLTLKEKLSITRIEHFSLVLEQQYSITKLLLLHEDEHIQEVVQKKESHECRCLFRVCFMPRDPEDLLDEDPVAFEYLYLQCVSDVLQERYAIEMKCNTALRLAALHIQERLASCGQSPKTPIKTITRDWGIENFVSSTLLRNMREKDLRKAISYHMKKSVVLEPKQKLMSVNQARLSYLSEMAELRSYGGRSFSATMMLQDRESMVSLLVGAQCGVSQVINHKLSIMNVLTEFSSITRIELVPESDRVSLVKIYLQDIKPITLLLETGAARELSCLLAGYCRLLVDPQSCVFPWPSSSQGHRISAEEGYVSRCGSESDDSDTDVDALLAHVANVARGNVETLREREEHKTGEDTEKEEEERSQRQTDGGTAEKDDQTEKGGESFRRTGVIVKDEEEGETADKGKTSEEREERKEEARCFVLLEEPTSEASDSCQSDSRVLASVSSDSMDALEEDDLLSFCSATRPCHLAVEHSYRLRDIERLTPSPLQHHYADISFNGHPHLDDYPGDIEGESFLCFAALSQIAECLPSPPEASDEDEDEEEGDGEGGIEGSGTSPHRPGECVFTFEQGDARRYYNICSSVTPDSARSLPLSLSPPVPPKQEDGGGEGEAGRALEPTPILQPPPGFGDSSSDDEFFDAQDRFLSPEQPSSAAMTRENSTESSSMKRTLSLSDIGVCMAEQMIEEGEEQNQKDVEVKTDRAERWSGPSRFQKRPRKRRSFMETDFTSLVSFPGPDTDHPSSPIPNHSFGCNGSGKGEKVNGKQGSTLSAQSPCPTVLSMTHAETEPSELESKSISQSKAVGSGNHRPDGSSRTGSNSSTATQRKQQQMEMEPDSMEFKSVTEHMAAASPSIVAVRSRTGPCENDSNSVRDGADLDDQGSVEGLVEQIMANHLFFELPARQEGNYSRLGGENDQPAKGQTEGLSNSFQCDSAPQLGQTAASSLPSLQIPTISLSPIHPGSDRIDAFVRGETQRFPVEPPERIRSQSLSATLGRAAPYRTRSMVRTRGLESQGPDGSDPAQRGPGQRGPPGVPGVEPGSVFLLAPCSSGLLGRLSASTLRGKIQSLPLYLSRSQETIAANANAKPERRFSDTRPRRNEVEVAREATEDPSACEVLPEVTEVKVVTIMSEEVTEVIEEVREVCHVCPQTQIEPELQEEPQDIPKEPSSSSPLQSEADANFKLCPPSVVVTTQNLNGPWSMARAGEFSPLQGGSCPHGCGRFANCEPRPTKTQPQSHGLCLRTKPNLGCSSVLTLGCETALEGVQTPLEVCGCQSVYTNCFSGVLDSTFDDELTVYEFSCQTQQQGNAGDSPLMCIPPSSFSPSPSSLSPSSAFPTFPQVLTQSSSTELSPLLSPLDVPDCFLSDSQEDSIATLLARRHPSAPTGFLTLQRDVDILLSVLAGAVRDQEGLQREQEHPKDSCASHFSVNKHRLHVGARGLLAGCQRVVRARQTPEETLQALVESFQSLVQLTGACLCFSSCSRCRERHAQVHTGLVDVLHTYREFARIAEHVGSSTGGRSCHDLSIKLLARQCTSLTTSVFCLTQLFRTLTAL